MERRGFTLVEIMVVLAVIGVLTAILLPVTGGLAARARDARRRSDIKTIEVALELFRERRGRYPTPAEAGTDSCSGWRATDTADFMQGVIGEGLMRTRPADPMNTGDGCNGFCYSYFRYGAGTNGVPVPFFVLGARELEEGPDPTRTNVGGAVGRDWSTEFHYLTWGRED